MKRQKTKAKKLKKTQARKSKPQQPIAVEDQQQNISNSAFETDVDTSFFYTSDKFFTKLDNNDIFDAICSQYPALMSEDDSVVKKTFVQLIRDKQYVNQLLEFYNINIYDFFKLIYGQFSSIFKGPYLKKIKTEFQTAKYK